MSASAGVPPAALVAAAAGSAGGRLWRQSLHLSALLSSVSWRDDKCNHQENNIILYLPRLYQVPYLPCAVQQDSGIFRSGMEFLIWENLFFWKNLWNDSSDTCDNLHICCETYWICRFTTIFCSVLVTLRWSFDVPFFCTRIIACRKTKCYNFFMQIVRIITHELQIGIGVLVEKNDELSFDMV